MMAITTSRLHDKAAALVFSSQKRDFKVEVVLVSYDE